MQVEQPTWSCANGWSASARLRAAELTRPGLAHVLVFSEGLDINGDALVRGLGQGLPSHVTVTGGLSADGEAFRETIVLADTDVCRHAVVGRRMVLGQRVEEEVAGVREVVGQHAVLTGFYSYGEISPFTPSARCELHNQTMTVTTLSES